MVVKFSSFLSAIERKEFVLFSYTTLTHTPYPRVDIHSGSSLKPRQGFVTHDFGHHDDVLMMVYSGSSLELSPEKSYLHLFPEITFLRKVRRLPIHLPARMHDSRRLP
jgi:hypothetical protein